MKKKRKFWISYIFLCIICLSSLIIPIKNIFDIDSGFLVTYDEVEEANKCGLFGSFITGKLQQSDTSVSTDKTRDGEIVFKLFGVIPIRKISVCISADDDYYIGGAPIGISITTDGAIVVENRDNAEIKEGDIITKINGQDVTEIEDFQDVLKDSDEAEITLYRKNKELKTLVKVHNDGEKYKLGIVVKDNVQGIGTLTYVNTKTGEYGALGHAVANEVGGNIIPVSSGKVYACNLLGISKGKKNEPGQLRCILLQNEGEKGEIESNDKFGINGTLTDYNDFIDENLTAKIGGRLSVRPGKATIVSNISGIKEEYEVEIIKANYQKKADDKSLVLRVTDKRLLALTGGIVQGMSGSPIMQNGKIVGAVTHVFLADPTKGYGVYCDWMLS